ncbi:MAG: PTS sugar transporter subunit IIA [Proteobacteria bacterium]|nr:PTS sugar transporter subunit IIA [Pseudomonadota bacterium]
MNILDILSEESILPDIKSANKKEVVEELAAIAASQNDNLELELLVEKLMEREKLGSTGVGDGVAIPHAKVSGMEALVAVFGRSIDGVDFDSMDGKKAHLFFLLVAPDSSTGSHLKALARISRLMQDSAFRAGLMEAKSREELFKVFTKEDSKY